MRCLLLLVFCCCAGQLLAQTNVPAGPIQGNWTLAGSPYLISFNHEIPDGDSLIIDPGVEIIFQSPRHFLVNGRIVALGTVTDSIVFKYAGSSSTGWLGLRYPTTASSNGWSYYEYCRFESTDANGSYPNNQGGVFFIDSFDKVSITHSRFDNTECDSNGGAIHARFCTPIIQSNTFSSCSATGFGADGGAIYLWASDAIILDNTFNNCFGDLGGALCIRQNSNVVVRNNVFHNNSGEFGGALYNAPNNPSVIEGNYFSNNSSTEDGGAIATYIYGVIASNVFANNTANDDGGALFGNGITHNNTFVNNNASSGDAVYGVSGEFINNIFWGNYSSNVNETFYMNGGFSNYTFSHNIIEGDTLAFSGPGVSNFNFTSASYQNNLSTSPQFISPSGGSGTGFNGLTANWEVQSTSPAVDGGQPNQPSYSTSTVDVNGAARVMGSQVDIGAYEEVVLSIAIITVPTTCANGTDGSLTASVGSGVQPYTYQWDNNAGSASTMQVGGLAAGAYSITVTDATGLTAVASGTVQAPSSTQANEVITPISCAGASNGHIAVNAIGGKGPITYGWSTGAVGDTIGNLAPGTYTVYMTDSLGCSDSASFTLNDPDTLNISIIASPIVCGGTNDGMLTANPVGGTTPYSYSWTGDSLTSSAPSISNLSPGNYDITLTDANGCTATSDYTLTSPPAITTTLTSSDASCATSSDGTITLAAAGGVAPLSFAWAGAANLPDTNVLGGLASGTYTCTVTDSVACIETIMVTIGAPALIDTTTTLSICSTDSVFFAGSWLNSTGTYSDTLTAASGCDSILLLNLTVVAPVGDTTMLSICSTDSVWFAGSWLTAAGSYSDTLAAASGCDSIATLSLTVTGTVNDTTTLSLCGNDSVLWHGSYYAQGGWYADSVALGGGCYNVSWLNLSNNTGVVDSTVVQLCPGDSILVGGVYQTAAGVYVDSLLTLAGCDSISVVEIVPVNAPIISISGLDTLMCDTASTVPVVALPAGGSLTGNGITNSMFDPAAAGLGVHTIVYTFTDSSGCSFADSAQVTVTTCVGIDESFAQRVLLFPNPARERIYLQFAEPVNGLRAVRCINALGQSTTLIATPEGTTRSSLNVAGLTPGVYLIELQLQNRPVYKRLVLK